MDNAYADRVLQRTRQQAGHHQAHPDPAGALTRKETASGREA
jgi:hypothetical protein